MCLGVPGRVTEIDGDTALVDFWGVRRRVRLDLVDEPVAAGDYVLNHVGFAIRRIPSEDVQATLALYADLVKQNTGLTPVDLLAADVTSEIAAAGIGAFDNRPQPDDSGPGASSRPQPDVPHAEPT